MIGENKMKKICSLLLVLCLIFSLSACGGNEPTTDNGTGSFCTECGEEISATDKFCGSCGASIDKANNTSTTDNDATQDNTDYSDNADVPSSTTSTPTTITKPETSTPSTTTKPSNPTHTHSYSSATCTTPAKCSCGATNGSALGHKYSNGVCSRCGGIDSSYIEYISFHDKYLENYIKLELGIDGKNGISTQDMCDLRKIAIKEYVSDIQDLKYAVNLKSIRISTSNVKNLSVLCTLPQINEIYIDHQITIDVSFMKNMNKIEKVYYNTSAVITAGSIDDIFSSPLLKIVALDTYDNRITSIDFLKDRPSIEEVQILGAMSENCDFTPLCTLPNLKELRLMCFVTNAQEKIILELMNNGVLISGQWALK